MTARERGDYNPKVGFAQMKCFDPAPYNESGFPMSPRPMSASPVKEVESGNRRTFTPIFGFEGTPSAAALPNDGHAQCGLGGHEEDPFTSKGIEQGYCQRNSNLPFINFETKSHDMETAVGVPKVNFSSALLPPPRYLQVTS